MQASVIKLQELIEGTRQYAVPLFQRPYSWKKSEWQVLWDDLEELCKAKNPRPHFMGSLVTFPNSSVPEGILKFVLIDGQQRLTTIFILFCVLRDRAKQTQLEELAAEINDNILVNRFKKGSDYYKLQPTQLDREAFYQIVKAEQQIDGSGISDCYLFFDKKITQSQLDFHKIKEAICSSLSLVSVVLSSDDDPYLVFESLNAKGRPLTQADLIRNYFFMQIYPNNSDEQQSIYEQYWQPMQTILDENLTEFIRHYLTKSGAEVKQSEIYFEIKGRVNKIDAVAYLKDLHKFAEYYAKFLNPDLEKNQRIRKYLYRINRLENYTIYPFLLNCYDDWMQERLAEEDLISILQILENFVIRRFVCNVQTRGLNRVFALLYSQVSKETDLASEKFVDRLKLALQSRDYPKDAEFKEKLINVNLYGSNRTEKAKLILESIEESFNHKEQVPFNNLSIEHIMPQTLNDWWKEHLGDEWEVTYELLLHSLGNLTLTAYNTELYNSNFLDKKNEFQKSHLEMNKYFHSQQSWTREDIEARGQYLADRVLQIWSYFGDESVQPSKASKFTGSTPKSLRVFGQEYSVKIWRDVLENTMNAIAERDPDQFTNIVKLFPRFVGWDQKKFRTTRTLKNGAFIEVNLSAKDIHNFCQKAMETAEFSTEEWEIEYSKNT